MELFWHQAPLVRIFFPLIIGIIFRLILGTSIDLSLFLWFFLISSIILVIALENQWKQYSRNHYFGILISLAFFLAGFILVEKKVERLSPKFEREGHFRAKILTQPAEKRKTFAVELKLLSSNSSTMSHQPIVLAYISKENFDKDLRAGTYIQFQGKISSHNPPRHPKQFDYGNYLRRNGIIGTCYLPSDSYLIEKEVAHSLATLLSSLRRNVLEQLEEKVPGPEEYGIIAALLLGERSFLDPELRDDFADAGAVHILAVSGLHVGIIYLFLLSVLNLFLRKSRFLKFLIVLFILWLYAGITGFSPSVLRAATMFSFIALGKLNGKFGNIYNMIAASAIVLLLFDPLLLTQVGFQLSYLAVVGIVFFYPHFYRLLEVENKWLDKVWSLICVSIAAQLATFPISVHYFNQFPNFFLLTNMVAIPLATAILYSGLVWIIFLNVPVLSDVLGFLVIELTQVLNHGVHLVSSLPYAKTEDIYLSGLEVFLMYALIAGSTVFFLHPSRRSLRISGALIIIFVLSIEYRSIRNTLTRELYFPNQKYNPTLILVQEKSALVFSSDTSKIVEFLARDLRPYLLSKGIRSENIEKRVLTSSTLGVDNFHLTKTDEKEEPLNLIWQTDIDERLVLREGEKIKEMPLATSPQLSPINTANLTPFSTDLLPSQRSSYH